MKLAALSDLHIPYVNLENLKGRIAREAPEIIIFAEDVVDVSNQEYFEAFTEAFALFTMPKRLVLGNHDLW